ncbi:MAG: uracil-DNA glycosylase, partial [Clostridia bacterium]|nr:uracil-DNA glycosylase [Clostridia bacterium]
MCPLHRGIHHKVPGQGDRRSPLMFIGEGPGQVEDEEGLAFVGPAGQLLTRMLAAISLPRDRVYICNIVKCRPPNNRVPEEAEAEACKLHLRMQVALVQP